ncbi:hypothetical protein DFH07DRAFT_804579 [Mycena maculata]|uniref:Uncharacterized protein n=1 Tax=Mycena maculata TaxID=230809 RepID=A0AAD7JSG7_9AGAR|nr:hypothetical protein DFH07DRAFT_804579 [Mycena maculata]
MMDSSIAFPTAKDSESSVAITRHSLSNHSTLSVVSATHATAVDVCTTMYGESTASSDAVERFYEPSAKFSSYENPVLTATSRSVITDIHQLSRQMSAIDVPRPLAMFCTLFRLQPPRTGFLARNIDDPLFQAVRVWTEIGEICENESFDGHRKTIVEHTLNILVLPGIHRDSHYRPQSSSDLLVTHSHATSHPSAPGLPVFGTSLTVPSPFHFKLHIITRLSFNEQGRITHHRDFWDVKDVMGLVPGVSLAQWIGTRLAAKSVTYVVSLWSRPSTDSAERAAQPTSAHDAMEMGMSPAEQFAFPTKDAHNI